MQTRGYNTIPTSVDKMSFTQMLNPTPERAYQIFCENLQDIASGNVFGFESEMVGAGFIYDEIYAYLEDFTSTLEN